MLVDAAQGGGYLVAAAMLKRQSVNNRLKKAVFRKLPRFR